MFLTGTNGFRFKRNKLSDEDEREKKKMCTLISNYDYLQSEYNNSKFKW